LDATFIGTEDVHMGRLSILSRKPVRLLVIFTLAFLVCLPIIRPLEFGSAQGQDQTQYYTTNFAWDYGGQHWVWNLSIPQAEYDAYKAFPDLIRVQLGPEKYGFFTTTQDSFMLTLAQKLNETGTQMGYSSYDQVNFVLAFVQSIPYAFDNISTGYQVYQRFPIETLVDNTGDCKSHSILFATLTLLMDYGTVFISPPDHLAVGVLGNNLGSAYWPYNNQSYYYCETTGSGFKIGQLPDQFIDQKAFVYAIDDSQQYVPNYQATSSTRTNPTIMPGTPAPTPKSTVQPNPSTAPGISQPTIQPVQPLSLNLISDSPFLFIVIAAAIGISIAVTIKTAKSSKETASPLQMKNEIVDEGKFCIYCGSSNKSFASYCERCGKKID